MQNALILARRAELQIEPVEHGRMPNWFRRRWLGENLRGVSEVMPPQMTPRSQRVSFKDVRSCLPTTGEPGEAFSVSPLSYTRAMDELYVNASPSLPGGKT